MLTPFCLTALSRSLLTSDRTNPEAVQVLAMAQGGMDSSLIYLAPHPRLFAVVNLAIRTYLPIPAIRPMRSLLKYQLVNFSNGTPLMSVAAQISQPFKPTASAVRVNVLWFLSLVLSVTCALSATLMQQWARRYQELAQHHGAPHRRGRTRAYIFDGISRFGMARAVATMPTLLHICLPLLRGSRRLSFPHRYDCFILHPRLGRGIRSDIRNIDGFTKLVPQLPLCRTPVRIHMAVIPVFRDCRFKSRPRNRGPISSCLVEGMSGQPARGARC